MTSVPPDPQQAPRSVAPPGFLPSPHARADAEVILTPAVPVPPAPEPELPRAPAPAAMNLLPLDVEPYVEPATELAAPIAPPVDVALPAIPVAPVPPTPPVAPQPPAAPGVLTPDYVSQREREPAPVAAVVDPMALTPDYVAQRTPEAQLSPDYVRPAPTAAPDAVPAANAARAAHTFHPEPLPPTAPPTPAELAILAEIKAEHRQKERAVRGDSGSTKKAVILSVIAVGLGHYRLGETERGVVFFAAALISIIAAALAPIAGAVALGITAYAAYDSYLGAQHFRDGGNPRPIDTTLLGVTAFSVLALLFGLVS